MDDTERAERVLTQGSLDELSKQLAERTAQAIELAEGLNLNLRDIADMLHLSHQRVDQIAKGRRMTATDVQPGVRRLNERLPPGPKGERGAAPRSGSVRPSPRSFFKDACPMGQIAADRAEVRPVDAGSGG